MGEGEGWKMGEGEGWKMGDSEMVENGEGEMRAWKVDGRKLGMGKWGIGKLGEAGLGYWERRDLVGLVKAALRDW